MAVFLVNQCTFSKLTSTNSDQQSVNGISQINQNSNDSTLNLNGNSVGSQQSNICGLKFDSLLELIQHIEENHIYDVDYPGSGGPFYNGQPQHQIPQMTQIINGGWLPTSCVLRIFNSTQKSQKSQQQQQLPVHHLMHKLQQATQQQQIQALPPQHQQIKYETTGIIMNQVQDSQQQRTNVIGPIGTTHMQLQLAPVGGGHAQGIHPQQMMAIQQPQMQVQHVSIPQQLPQMPIQQITIQHQPQPQQPLASQPPLLQGTIQTMPVQQQQQGTIVQQLSVQPQLSQQPQGIPAQQIPVQALQQPTTQIQTIQQVQPMQQTQPMETINQQASGTPTNSIQKATKVYPCAQCSKTYKTQRGLRTHKNTHHPDFIQKKEN